MKTVIFLLLSNLAFAQAPGPDTHSGRFMAANYGQWQVQVQSASGSKACVSPTAVTLGDGSQLKPWNINASILIGSGANQETVIPTAFDFVSTPGQVCISATYTKSHFFGDSASSGTFGLQEALNAAGVIGGGAVTIDQNWTGLGGITAIKNAASLPSNVLIEDARTGVSGASGGGAGQNVTGNPTPLVWAAAYGVVSGNVIADATTSNTSSIVTCPNADCHFLTTASVGQLVFAQSNCGTFGVSTTTILPVGTIASIDSDTQIHASTTANASQVGNACLAWGKDNSTVLDTAFQAAGTLCATLQLPSGYLFTKVPQFNYSAKAASCVQFGPNNVHGTNNTIIVPTPDFNFATGGHGSNGCYGFTSSFTGGCFFGVFGQSVSDVAINGLGSVGANYGGSTTRALVLNNAAVFFYFTVTNWCPGNSCLASTGYVAQGIEATSIVGGSMTAGQIACVSTASNINGVYENWPCEGSPTGIFVTGTSTVYSYGNIFSGQGGGQGDVWVASGSSLISVNDRSDVTGTNFLQVAGTISLNGYQLAAAGSPNLPTIAAGGILNATNTTFPSSSGNWASIATGGKFFDLGGNSVTGAVSGTCGATCVFGSASGTGVTITSAKLVLSGTWGSTAAWSALTGRNNVVGTITASGTGQGASPTITYTFPAVYLVAPQWCSAVPIGGTQFVAAPTATFTPSSLTATGVIFTYSATPGAGNTLVLQIQCQN